MKIRLIEPDPPVMHMWSYTAYPRLGLPMIGAALKAAGHDVLIYAPKTAPVDWADVESADLVGLSTTTSTAPAAYAMADRLRARGDPRRHRRLARHVHGRRGPRARRLRRPRRGRRGAHARAHRGPRRRARAGHRRAASRSGATAPRSTTTSAPPCPDLDQLPMPDLDLIVGHEGVNSMPIMTSWGCPFDCTFCSVTAMFGAQVPLPQRGERDGRAARQAPEAHLLLRRQPRRQQGAAQAPAEDDDRRGDRRPVAGADAHRRRQRRGAARPDAQVGLRAHRARSRVARPGDARRFRQVADRRRHRARDRASRRARHPELRHVRRRDRRRHARARCATSPASRCGTASRP